MAAAPTLWQKFVTGYLAVLTLLMPLKFGSLVGLPQAPGYYPAEWFPWLIITWPVMLFPMLAAGGLALSVAAFPYRFAWHAPLSKSLFWWLAAFLSAFLGLIGASTADYGWIELVHLGGLAAYALSVCRLLIALPSTATFLLYTAAVGSLLSVLSGAEQFFFGFDRQAEYLEQQLAAGARIAADLQVKMLDRRIYGNFTVCNTLAGYLLLTGPLLWWAAWRFFRRFDPPKVTLGIFMPIVTALLLLCYFGTKSRASFLALLITLVLGAVLFSRRKVVRYGAILLTIATVLGGAWYIHHYGRGFDSMLVRFDYSIQAFKMMCRQPLTGTGWGDFFYDYMAGKLIESDEAPHTPHNLIMAFGSQCGLLSFLAVLGAVLYPLLKGAIELKRRQKAGRLPFLPAALWFGLVAFYFHALVDTHLQSPGLMGTVLLLNFYLMWLLQPEENVPIPALSLRISANVLLLLTAAVVFGGGWRLLRADFRMSRLDELCQADSQGGSAHRFVTAAEIKAAAGRAVEAQPGSPFPYLAAADYFLKRRQLSEAKEYFEKALPLSPERAATYQRLAFIALEQRRYDEAEALASEAIRRFPHKEEYHQLLDEIRTRKSKSPVQE